MSRQGDRFGVAAVLWKLLYQIQTAKTSHKAGGFGCFDLILQCRKVNCWTSAWAGKKTDDVLFSQIVNKIMVQEIANSIRQPTR